MTEINLHGALGEHFGKVFKARINKPSEAFGFLEANKPGFRKKVRSMSLMGMHYAIIVDGKKVSDIEQVDFKTSPKKIDIIPLIVGSGPVSAIVKIIIYVVTIILAIVALVSILSKSPKIPKLESSTRALAESFFVSNKANIASQGTPIPVGYGRLLIGSYVTETTEKNYPQNKEPLEFYKNGPGGTFASSGSSRSTNPVLWPNENPVDYRGWLTNMSVIGSVDFNLDPNRSNTGFVGGGWQGIESTQSVGSIRVSMQNTGTGFVNVFVEYGEGFIPYAFTMTALSLGPGSTYSSFLGQFPEQWRTDWGTGEAIRRTKAAVGSTIGPYGAVNPIDGLDKGFKGYGGSVSRTGGKTMFMYMVPAGLPFSIKDQSNVIARGVVRISTGLTAVYWNNKTFSELPFFDPIYPYGTCNGRACHANATSDQPAAGCYLQGWSQGSPWPAVDSNYSYKPCNAGGVGPTFRQNTNRGGVGPQVTFD